MGRPPRTEDGTAATLSVKLSASELHDLDLLVAEHGLSSRGAGLRLALQTVRGRRIALSERAVVSALARRCATIEEEPLGDAEVLVDAATLSGLTAGDVRAEVLPAVAAAISTHAQCHGWFYPKTRETVEDVLNAVALHAVEGPGYSGMGRTGMDFLKARFPSYWHTLKGPVESTADEQRLHAVLSHMLGLSSAQRPVDITLAALRRGFAQQRMAVSFFRPAVAAGIYRRWINLRAGTPAVWDPSGGFGARMLGFFAAFPGGEYHAHEPATRTCRDLQGLGREMPGRVKVYREGSEFAAFAEESLDLVFTSPPYFDTERYFDEPGQAWVEYPTIEAWRDRQLTPTLRAAFTGLRRGAYAIYNISADYRADVLVAAQAAGFELHAEEALLLRNDQMVQRKARHRSGTRREPILVFRKPFL
jgi:hypothetical protein